jgi:hypothetical protein
LATNIDTIGGYSLGTRIPELATIAREISIHHCAKKANPAFGYKAVTQIYVGTKSCAPAEQGNAISVSKEAAPAIELPSDLCIGKPNFSLCVEATP